MVYFLLVGCTCFVVGLVAQIRIVRSVAQFRIYIRPGKFYCLIDLCRFNNQAGNAGTGRPCSQQVLMTVAVRSGI